MKIQEMKSGFLHLNRKMENERREDLYETPEAGNGPPAPAMLLAADRETAAPASELDEPRWSVVSFDQMEAGGLMYNQASALLAELDSHGVAGLCIVTDEAAARVKKTRKTSESAG